MPASRRLTQEDVSSVLALEGFSIKGALSFVSACKLFSQLVPRENTSNLQNLQTLFTPDTEDDIVVLHIWVLYISV